MREGEFVSEDKTVYLMLLKQEAMSQDSWAQMMHQVTTVLEAHAKNQVRHWVSAASSKSVSCCWEFMLRVDQETCVRGLLARIADVYSSNAFKWSRADVSFVSKVEA